jgi:hypothetical protein
MFLIRTTHTTAIGSSISSGRDSIRTIGKISTIWTTAVSTTDSGSIGITVGVRITTRTRITRHFICS